MFVRKLRIFNNYRRFHDLTIELGENPKRIIALIGPNGCGKSSVFDAMIYRVRAHKGPIGNAYNSNKGQDYHFMNGSEENDYRSVDITFADGQSIDDIMKNTANQTGNTLFSFRSSYRYNSVVDIKEIRAVDSIEKNNVGASTSSDIDQRMEDNYRRLIAKYRDYYETNEVTAPIARAHIFGELNKAIMNCLDIEIVDLGSVEGGKGSIYFKKYDNDKSFSFNVLSSGEKEVVDILIDLYLRKDSYSDTVFLLDEPELHISTAIQRKLLVEIDKMIGCKCQVWIATHSIGFIRALQEELDDITSLLAPKRIIYCEGRDRPNVDGSEKGFDAQVFNTIFGDEFADTLFVSAGGHTELEQRREIAVAIIGKALPDTEIWILKDRDMASGKTTNENDRQDYLQMNTGEHRVLNRFEIENYLFDKSVLRNYCKLEGRLFNEVKYDSLNFDIVNDDVKSFCNVMAVVCGFTGNVNAEKFKLKLAHFLTQDLPIYTELKEVVFNRK